MDIHGLSIGCQEIFVRAKWHTIQVQSISTKPVSIIFWWRTDLVPPRLHAGSRGDSALALPTPPHRTPPRRFRKFDVMDFHLIGNVIGE